MQKNQGPCRHLDNTKDDLPCGLLEENECFLDFNCFKTLVFKHFTIVHQDEITIDGMIPLETDIFNEVLFDTIAMKDILIDCYRKDND